MIAYNVIQKICFLSPFLLINLFYASTVLGQLRVDITSGNPEPLPIAVTEFFGSDDQSARVARQIASVISRNLQRSGLFRLINRKAFIQTRESLRVRPQFPAWRQINAQALLIGNSEMQANGQIRVDFRLWDVFFCSTINWSTD